MGCGCNEKKKKCSCNTIYRQTKLPIDYNFAIDSNLAYQIFVPINEFAPEEEYYTDFSLLTEIYNSYSGDGFTANVGGINNAFCTNGPSIMLTNLADTLIFMNAQDWSGCGTNKHIATAYVLNENYGQTISPDHHSFLKWPLNQNLSYSELKDPFWKLNFPYCGADKKEEFSGNFKIESCDTVKVEWRLRARPLVFLGWPEDSTCKDYDAGSGESTNTTENLRKMWLMYMFANSLKTQNGSKYLGLSPLRLETGIYDNVNKKEHPIVWSASGYPQPILKARNVWNSKYADGKYIYCANAPEKRLWSGMSPNLISATLQTIELQTRDSYFYGYGTSRGLFSTSVNDLETPSWVILSRESQVVGDIYNTDKISLNLLKEGPANFFYELEWVTDKYGNLEIYQQGLIDGEWKNLRKILYSITGAKHTQSSTEIKVTHISTTNYLVDDIEDLDKFYNGSTIKTRYEVIPYLYKKTYNVPKLDWNEIKVGNLSELTEDFVFELEGFCHVPTTELNDFSIYLKALPNYNGSAETFMNSTTTIPEFYSGTQGTQTDFLGNPIADEKWPWGILSADERTGFQEQFKKVYEPFLPLKASIVDYDSTKPTSREAGKEYRFGYVGSDGHWGGDVINDWFVMIEEGWVRVTETCENCCDASKIKKIIDPITIPVENDLGFTCDGTEDECRDGSWEGGTWTGCEGLIYMPEDYVNYDAMALDYGGSWEIESFDGIYWIVKFADGSRWKDIGLIRPVLCPESEG